MSYCTNRDCPHQLRSGRAAEYRDAITTCAECGESLTPGHLPAVTAQPRPPWPKPLRRRLWLTVGVLVACWLFTLVPSPYFDLTVLAGIGSTASIWASMGLGPFSFGLWPVVLAFVLVELVTLVVPRWNRRRQGDPEFRGKMNTAAIRVGLGCAFLFGIAAATFMMRTEAQGVAEGFMMGIVREPGLGFQLGFALTQTAGTGIMTLLALAISRRGVGNGFVVILGGGMLLQLPLDFRATLQLGGGAAIAPERMLWYGLGLAVMILALWRVVNRPVRRTAGGVPLPSPTCSCWPLDLSVFLVMVPAQVAFLLGAARPGLLSSLLFKGIGSLFFFEAGVVLATAPLMAWLLYWRYQSVLKQPSNAMDWYRARLRDAGLLLWILLGWEAVHLMVGPSRGSALTPLLLFLLVALAADLWAEVTARRRALGGVDLVPLASYQHPVEALLDLEGRPSRAGAVIQHLRFRSLTYLLCPFVPVRVLGATQTHQQDECADAADGDPDDLSEALGADTVEIHLQAEWSEAADEDLDELSDALEAEDPDAAGEMVQRVLDAADSLVEWVPERRSSDALEDIREIAVPGTDLTLRYRVQDTTAELLRVLRKP